MFGPIIASNLMDVLHITKTVPNYAHLMWVLWLNFVQLGAAAWWRIQQLYESSPPVPTRFPKVEPGVSCSTEIDMWLWWKNMMYCSRAANSHGTDFMILQTLYLVPKLWPCCYLQHTVKLSTVVTECHSVTVWHYQAPSQRKLRVRACSWKLAGGGMTQSYNQ